MTAETRSKNTVPEGQLLELLDFLQGYKEVADGLVRVPRGSVEWWNQCAKELNNYRDGVTKTPKEWSKFWCEWKYRVKRRALELKGTRKNHEQSKGYQPLTPLQERIIQMMGETKTKSIEFKRDSLDKVSTGQVSNAELGPKQRCLESTKNQVSPPKLLKRKAPSRIQTEENANAIKNATVKNYITKPGDDEVERKRLIMEATTIKSIETMATRVTLLAQTLTGLKNSLNSLNQMFSTK